MKALRYEYVTKKLLQRYWRLSRGLTLGVRALVIDGDNRLLLIRHTYMRGWHFPGGGVEFNETVQTALERELLEETGIGINGDAPELFGIYSNGERFPGDHVILFVVRAWEHRRMFTPTREIAEVRFFPQDALPEGTTHATLHRIDEFNGRRKRQAAW
ncbi:MAG: NUDIX domain-containing protein [Hyphomicrobiaceae bacterium]